MKIRILLYFLLFTGITYSQTKRASTFGFTEKDATYAFVSAIKSDHDTIVIDRQRTDWILKPSVINNVSNKVIIIEEGVIIRAKKNAFPKKGDVLLKLLNSSNLKIIGYGAALVMNKDEYVDGEWRMTLSIINCTDITIKGLKIASSGGDGIYIDGWKQGEYSKNITIEDVVSENHKRQGMSIISAENVFVKNSVFKDTKGTLPEAGLDLEPDDPKDRLVNINFENCKFINNNHSGILLALNKLNSQSLPVSISFTNCFLSMNHKPENAYASSEIVFGAASKNPVGGAVVFNNLLIDGSDWGILYSRKTADAYTVTFNNSKALNICQAGTMAPVYLEVPDYYKSSGPLGGFYFNNFTVSYATDLPFVKVRGSTLRTLKGLENIKGTVSINKKNEELWEYIKYHPSQNRNVQIKFNFLDKP